MVVKRKKSEDVVRKACNAWLKANYWIQYTIYTGGIPIGAGRLASNPAKGIPDCVAFNRRLKRMIWIEYKNSDGGTVSIDQKDWHYLLKFTGNIVWVISSLQELQEKLKELEDVNDKSDSLT